MKATESLTLVPASQGEVRPTPVAAKGSGVTGQITIERLEKAITITAYVMDRHNLPQLLPNLKRLLAERERLRADGDPIEFARRILERSAVAVQPCFIDQRRDAA